MSGGDSLTFIGSFLLLIGIAVCFQIAGFHGLSFGESLTMAAMFTIVRAVRATGK